MEQNKKVKEILDKIENVNIAVYGDFCLDVYWMLDPRKSEISVETGLQAEAIAEQNYTLGGASNITANLAALNPKSILAFGAYGNDIYGREMISQLNGLGIDTSGMVLQKENFATNTFCKVVLEGKELPRFDFGIYNNRSKETDAQILENIEASLSKVDVCIINQQVPDSITDSFIDGLNKIIANNDDKVFIVDSRQFANKFKNCSMKVNESEAANYCGIDASPDDKFSVSKVIDFAKLTFEKSGKPVFITRGNRGIIAYDDSGLYEVHGIQITKKIDTVGAGDTTLSALACAIATQVPVQERIEFANFAAGVTVQKLFQTGVATPAEILEFSADPNYIYQPELAEDVRRANYYEGSELELCYSRDKIEVGTIKHAVFDHDGTISVLREGWEKIMEPVMVKAILGDHYATADETLYHKVVSRVIAFIDQSTGIQTVVQMQGLVELVEEFGLVPKDQILDKFGYKEIFNNALMEMVNARIAKLKSGELDVNDFIVKGSVDFLKYLRDKGITLYLASGTDREDVLIEAKAMGYADLFNGGIYGAVGDISKYSKKIVLNNIMKENNLHGSELVTFGDGPVEMRECRKVGGTAIGIGSDEIRRHGLNLEKRVRLIRSGTQLLIPDFSQQNKLKKFLFG